ncbi:MAG TPA: L,D-transpeptidase [Solirubrobacteraceae bacterium]|jgi:L,D-transpeptidase catalytic domain|nr:L,D-transpeptidase [Solirubrobacteraceae bacterium]
MRSLAAAAALGVALVGCGETAAPPAPAGGSDHFAVVEEGDRAPRGRFLTARVVRRAALRVSPGGRVVARIGRRTEFGSRRVLAVTGRRGPWLRVIAAERRNGRHAWLRASAARLGATDVWVRVDRSRRQLTLRRGHRVLLRFPVAVGRPGTPTPIGRFAVTDRLHAQRPDSPYGCCAVALSGHQTELLPGWPGGDRLAVHGTPNPVTVGRPVSLGCMRARERDIRALMRAVPLGAPVVVAA